MESSTGLLFWVRASTGPDPLSRVVAFAGRLLGIAALVLFTACPGERRDDQWPIVFALPARSTAPTLLQLSDAGVVLLPPDPSSADGANVLATRTASGLYVVATGVTIRAVDSTGV